MISIIIPFYNESESLPTLIIQIIEVIRKFKEKVEIILVDDGSTDAWRQNLKFKILNLKLIQHRKRLGKGKALLSGFNASKGDIIVFMDADLQDDPKDLPNFIKEINNGYDLINGWRKNRVDPLSKTLPSFIFNNFILKTFFKSKFHDLNCGYKAMKRQVLEEIKLYGDNYRFLPIMAEQAGFKTGEVIVTHHPRKWGVSKFGFFRLFFGFIDTITAYFVSTFTEKPLHFFGPIGAVLFIFGFLITAYLIVERIFFHILLYRRPSLLIGILLIMVGVQVIMTGIIAELVVFLHKKNNT